MYEILIVDDEEKSRNGLAQYFPWEECGFHVSGTVSNGVEALEFLKEHVVHVVLTDICMPVMDGIELVVSLNKDPNHPCVVFLSAYDDFRYAQEAIKYGVRFYILKPSDFSEIRQTFCQIKQELDGKYHMENTVYVKEDADEIIRQTYEYIQQEFATASLNELGKRLYLSPSYLSQLIKSKTKRNFVDLLLEVRMQQAVRLLQQDIKIYQISNMVGYTNPNNFARAFKAYFQLSPKEYREAYSEKRL